LYGQAGGFAVAHLADHDDIRVLAQECAQAVHERHAGHGVGLGLVGARDTVFHRIFHCGNVYAWLVEYAQDAEETGRLNGPSWPSHKNHAMGLQYSFINGRQARPPVTELFESIGLTRLVEDAHNHFFAINNWQRRNTQSVDSSVDRNLKAAILWRTPLVNL